MRLTEATPLVTYPYSVGAILAVNAIRDAYLLLDAPTCALWRPGQVCGGHDLMSTLWEPSGVHRVQVSCTTTEKLIKGNQVELAEKLRRMSAVPGCGAVLALGFPMATISGVPYETIWRNLTPAPEVPFYKIRGGATSADWLDGYAETLAALARGVELSQVPRQPEKVALVGYLWDRNEWDHVANLAEVRRMLGALGLELCSVWLDGGRASELPKVAEAGSILSLPYGREAAALLAERTGARLVECDLPLGLEGSADFVVQVGRELGRERQAESFIEAELTRFVPRLERAVSEHFAGIPVGFVGDPYLLGPMSRMVNDLGARMVLGVGLGRRSRREEVRMPSSTPEFRSEWGLALGEVEELDLWLRAQGGVACLLGSIPEALRHLFLRPMPLRPVEVGFPSETSHALHERPFLGFQGAVCLAGRMLDEILALRVGAGS